MADLILDISAEFLKNLEKADKRIMSISNVSFDAKNKLQQMFQIISQEGAGAAVSHLKSLRENLELISRASVKVEGFDKLSSDVQDSIDKINLLVRVLSQVDKNAINEKYFDLSRGRGGLGSENKKEYEKEYREREKLFDQAIREESERKAKQISDFAKWQLDAISNELQAKRQAEADMQATRKRNLEEYKQLWINLLNEKDAQEKRQLDAKASNQKTKSNSAQAAKAYEEQLRMYARMFDEIEKREKEASERSKRNKQKELDDKIRAEQEYAERMKAIRRAENERERKQIEDELKRKKDANRRYLSTYEGAMKVSNNAKNLYQEQQAIKYLQEARAKLFKDADYERKLKEINDAIAKHNKNIAVATGKTKELKNEQQKLVDVSSNLTRILAAIFSLNQIKNYIGKIVDVRKEFELQHKSLQIIIQDQDKANELWQQTVDLGLKSPFRIKELVKYTKQLAAYRIETDKLHDATSRLADMSAGLGVDMQRLILAYGQVRAAEYLRGTELRQFTEAGVPMLDELATYFTELEGKAVSTAEVFKRISKRMVTFADVEHVIERMTSKTEDYTGVFYKMQEQQAQTLNGMISNLYDSIDLMMNDIGKANDDFLKNTIGVAKTVVDNWRAIATAIESIGAVMAVISIKNFASGFRLASTATAEVIKEFKGAELAGAKLNIVLKGLNATIKANQWVIWVTLITTATVALVNHYKKMSDVNKKYDELNAGVIRQIDKIADAQEKNKEYGKTIEENNEIIKSSASSEEQVLAARRENSKILKLLIEAYPDVYSGIKQNENGTIELTKAINEQNEALERQLLLNNLNKGNFWLEDFQKNYSDVKSSIGEVEFAIIKMQSATANMRADLKLANKKGIIDDAMLRALENYIDAIKKAKTEEEALYAFNKLHEGSIGFGVGDIVGKYLENYSLLYRKTNEMQRRLDTLGQNLSNHIDNIKVSISEMNNDADKASFIDKYIEQLGVADERTKEFAREFITKKIGIELTFVDTENGNKEYTTKDFVYGWQHTLYEAFQKLEQTDKTLALRLGIGIDDIALANDAEEIRDKVEPILQSIVDEQQGIAKWKGKTGQLVYSQEAIENAEDAEKQLRKIGELLAITFKKEKDGGRDGEDIYARRIKLIRDMAKAYERLNKTFASNESQIRVVESYSEAFKDLFDGIMDIQDVKFTTPKGVVAALKVLEESGKLTAKQMRDVKKAIAEVSTEIDEAAQKISGEQMTKSIEDMFGKYELSLELQKLDIPQDFAKELFDIDVSSLGDITAKINKELASGMWGKDVEDKLKEFQRKVAEMEAKEQDERLKTYLKYTRDAIGERAKIKLEELRKLDEIEQTFEKQKRMAVTTDEYRRLEEAKQRAILGVKKESLAEMQKLEWEQFKSSDVFINMFNDLDNASTKAIDSMIDQLEKYKKEWSNLPVDQMKEVAKQLERMKKAQTEREALANPFDSGFMQTPSYKKRQNAEMQILNTTKMISDINASIANDELKMQEYAEGKSEMSVKEYRQLVEHRNELVKQLGLSEDYISTQQGIIDNYDLQKKKLKAQSDALGQSLDAANDLYDAFKDLAEELGADADSPAMIFADMGMNMANTVIQTLQLQLQLKAATVEAGTFAAAMNSAMGVIGWIVMGVQLLTAAIKAIVQAHDNSLQKQIESWQFEVERLQESYENLSDVIEEAYSLVELEKYSREMQHLNNQMIDAYKEMIALEEAKKQTDEDAIKDMEKSIKDLQSQNADLLKNMFSEATDGILDSVKDAARDFTDAWFDAFKETGDGMKGLEDTFNEMIANMIKQQISMSVVSPYLERWKNQLEGYIDPEKGDLTLSIDEANKFAETVKNEMPYLNESLENAFRPIADLVNLYGDAGDLTGLQKGIQGITETQAEEISAYLNSIRFFISQQNDTLLNLAQRVLSVNDAENPIVAQLRIIATQTTAINELLNSLTTPFSGGGRGFKVVI